MDIIDMLILADISSPIVPDFEILALSIDCCNSMTMYSH